MMCKFQQNCKAHKRQTAHCEVKVSVCFFFFKRTQLCQYFSGSCLVSFAKNTQECVMFRNNINRTPQTVRGGSCLGRTCNVSLVSLLCWFLCQKNILWYSGWYWQLLLTHADLVEFCCFCWIEPPLLIYVWYLLLNWTAGTLTMKSELAARKYF